MIFKVLISGLKWTLYVWCVLLVSVFLDIYLNPVEPGQFPDENIGLEIDQLVKKNGYPFEKHSVTTEDGYLLEMHRIPHGKTSTNTKNRPPIILMHGLLGSSAVFVYAGEKHSLAYYLADRGYDVWLPNARGNFYSRHHQTIDPDKESSRFFNFSWDEIGRFDLPASIDHVLEVTKQKKLYYSGHSQGSVAFFVMLSERPEYNEKVKGMVALAPVVYTKHTRAPNFQVPAMFQKTSEWLTEFLNLHELLPISSFWKQFSSKYCKESSPVRDVCTALLWTTGGFNHEQTNKTLYPLFFTFSPAGAATKQLFHYTQIINSDEFQKYDHGTEKNMKKYDQETPPLYKFENMKVPVAIFYGANDWLTLQNDIDRLQKNLPNVILYHRVEDENFAHYDFVGSNNVVEVLYSHVLDVLKTF